MIDRKLLATIGVATVLTLLVAAMVVADDKPAAPAKSDQCTKECTEACKAACAEGKAACGASCKAHAEKAAAKADAKACGKSCQKSCGSKQAAASKQTL